ncbi:hypothetical protein ACU6TU_12640 [Halomonas sp. LS-001]
MKKITKGTEPSSLATWKHRNPHGRYKQLTEVERQAIRNACTQEQFYLCAYCCQNISGTNIDTMNEHLEAQDTAPHKTLNFSNIVASCTTSNQCDAAHGSQSLPLTPLMNECESELQFMISGRVRGLTERARRSIAVLNLGDHERNNKGLIEKRKYLSHNLLWAQGVDPEEGLEDDVLLKLLIDELCTPKNGKLEPYAPVVVNVLQQWLSSPSPNTTN